jgi:hypothetical protein
MKTQGAGKSLKVLTGNRPVLSLRKTAKNELGF